ncbi:hypothetical protein KP806_07075 [Paenibacillus sp. N4]|uniref:CBO0543 family protein n=1 Tax=Paenibacillus vietnamensis TaxID=2590547 RepID=UPI001CD13D67|nr:CBO0543 family protein [Paenibacillus vietnamensis]MCA0754809.1 hypothetical protein [Paenibacillus vietnamensis]
MHLVLGVISIISVWRRGDWRNWKKYHTTMMYFALGNLLYNFLTANYFLWRLNPDLMPNHSMTEMLYTFVIFPATSLLFLCNYPEQTNKKMLHYFKWILIYIAVEWFFSTNSRILYQHGWNLMWSAIFDVTMFPMLRLHHKRPLLAYVISAIFCVFWVWKFEVPVDMPIEKRAG